MKPRRCYKSSCMKNAEFSCNCTASETFMCHKHMSKHASNKGSLHNIQSISGIDPKIKKQALDLLYEERLKIGQLKGESLSSFAHLISSLENLFEKYHSNSWYEFGLHRAKNK